MLARGPIPDSSHPPLFMKFVYLAIDDAEGTKFGTNEPLGGIFGTKAPRHLVASLRTKFIYVFYGVFI